MCISWTTKGLTEPLCYEGNRNVYTRLYFWSCECQRVLFAWCLVAVMARGADLKWPCKCQDIVRASRSGDVVCTFSGRRHAVMFELFVVILSPSREMLMYGACEHYGSAVF